MTTHIKKRFYVYGSWEEQFEILTTEEKATMLMNLFKYSRGIEPTLDTTGLKLVWAGMKFLLEQDDTKYQEAVSRAQKSAQAKKLPEPANTKPEPVNILWPRIDNDNVNVNVNENENGNEVTTLVNIKRHTSSSIPGRVIPNKNEIEDILNW
jgi:hypothetical protein